MTVGSSLSQNKSGIDKTFEVDPHGFMFTLMRKITLYDWSLKTINGWMRNCIQNDPLKHYLNNIKLEKSHIG